KPPHLNSRTFVFFSTPRPSPQTYPLSLHDALPISSSVCHMSFCGRGSLRLASKHPSLSTCAISLSTKPGWMVVTLTPLPASSMRSEEHTSELQSREKLVCRLLLEKKKTTTTPQKRT